MRLSSRRWTQRTFKGETTGPPHCPRDAAPQTTRTRPGLRRALVAIVFLLLHKRPRKGHAVVVTGVHEGHRLAHMTRSATEIHNGGGHHDSPAQMRVSLPKAFDLPPPPPTHTHVGAGARRSAMGLSADARRRRQGGPFCRCALSFVPPVRLALNRAPTRRERPSTPANGRRWTDQPPSVNCQPPPMDRRAAPPKPPDLLRANKQRPSFPQDRPGL